MNTGGRRQFPVWRRNWGKELWHAMLCTKDAHWIVVEPNVLFCMAPARHESELQFFDSRDGSWKNKHEFEPNGKPCGMIRMFEAGDTPRNIELWGDCELTKNQLCVQELPDLVHIMLEGTEAPLLAWNDDAMTQEQDAPLWLSCAVAPHEPDDLKWVQDISCVGISVEPILWRV